MDELINKIAELVDKRISEEYHMTSETARHLIKEDINEYISNFLKKELPYLITNKICGKYRITDYNSYDCDFSGLVERAIHEIAGEKFK